VKPNINSVEVHPQPSNKEHHPVDVILVGVLGSLWPTHATYKEKHNKKKLQE
jgi:hypothetical protein